MEGVRHRPSARTSPAASEGEVRGAGRGTLVRPTIPAAAGRVPPRPTRLTQQAGTFDKKAFIASVKTAIEAKSPKTLKEADEDRWGVGQGGRGQGRRWSRPGGPGKAGQQARDIEQATAAAGHLEVGAEAGHPDGPRAASGSAVCRSPPPVRSQAGAARAGQPRGRRRRSTRGGGRQRSSDEQLAESARAAVRAGCGRQAREVAAAHADTAPGEYRLAGCSRS